MNLVSSQYQVFYHLSQIKSHMFFNSDVSKCMEDPLSIGIERGDKCQRVFDLTIPQHELCAEHCLSSLLACLLLSLNFCKLYPSENMD